MSAADNDGRIPVTRRNFIAGAVGLGAIAASSALFPAIRAWAIGVGAGYYFEGGGTNGGTLYHGRYVGYATSWKSWQISSSQWLRVAFALKVGCDYSNELYDHIVARPYMACGDTNNYKPVRQWYDGGDDNWGYVYVDGKLKSEFHGDLVNTDLSSGYGRHDGGFKDYAYDVPKWFQKRGKAKTSRKFRAKVDIYNYYDWGKWPWTKKNPGQTLWTSYITQASDKIALSNRWDLFGSVVRITPDLDREKCVDVKGGSTANSTRTQIWGYYGTTSQNYAVQVGPVDDTGKGHLHMFAAAHVPGLGSVLNESGGSAPSTTSSKNLRIYKDDGTAACRWWLHTKDGCEFAFCDGTGRNFDRQSGGISDGTYVNAYSSGYCDQWTNEAAKWHFEEVLFEGALSLSADEAKAGEKVSASDPSSTCEPYDAFGTGSVQHLYRWYISDGPSDGHGGASARIRCRAHRADWGEIATDLYADRACGLPSQGKALDSFKLWLEGSPWPGSLAYRATSSGKTVEGADGSWLGTPDGAQRLSRVEAWLEGEAAEHYDVGLRAYMSSGGWTAVSYSAPDAPASAGGSGHALALQAFLVPKPAGAVAVTGFVTDGSYVAQREHNGKYATCACILAFKDPTTATKNLTWRYEGTVLSSSCLVRGFATVTCYADGEEVGSFEVEIGDVPSVPDDIALAARREGCSGWEGWFSDEGCENAWAPAAADQDISIYSYNVCRIANEVTDRTREIVDAFEIFSDEGLTDPAEPLDPHALDRNVRYGASVAFAPCDPETLFWSDALRTRTAPRTDGVFLDPSASGDPVGSATAYGDATVYHDWNAAGYEGIIVG